MQKYLNYVAQLHENKQNEIDFINNQLAKHLKTEQENQTEIEHILDFLFATDKSYKNIWYKTILEKAIAWDKKLQSLSSKDEEIEWVDYEVVYDFWDWYRFVKLKSQSSYNREWKLMSHCVASYYGRDVAIYSLRDSNNNPHCTIEENKQVKWKWNQTVDNKYFWYCIKLLHHLWCKMWENEMRNIWYYKLDSIDEWLTCDELRDWKYVSEKNIDKIKDKDWDVYMWFWLLKIKKLFEFDLNMKLKFNFDMNVITSYFRSKLKKWKIDKESYNEVAMTDNNEVAMTDNNKVAMTDNNKVAMTYNNEVAMTDNNKVAMTYYNKVAMTYYNKVAMTYNNKVAMTSYNKVAMTDNNDAVWNSENTISCWKNNAILMWNDSKVKWGIWTIIVLYNRDNNNTITDYATAVVDWKKIKEDTFYKLEWWKFVKCK